MRKFIYIILAFYLQSSFATPLSSPEKQIRDHIIHHQQAQLALLEKLVNINSGTTNPKGVRKVGKILRPEFARLGFKTYWVEEPESMHHAGTLIAERKGSKGKRLLLIGHLDTVFPPTGKFQHFVLHKNSATGPGVADDKGGIVVILSALKALQAAHALNNTSITVVLTGDEEESGKPTAISRKPLIDAAANKDAALDFEASVSLENGTIGRRGIGAWTIAVHGNESHSATIFQHGVGVGAIFGLAHILDAMRDELARGKNTTFNPGMILGGMNVDYDRKTSTGSVFGKNNVVSKIAIAKGDIRFSKPEELEAFKNKMTAIVKQNLPGIRADIAFEDGIPAMAPTKANLELLKQYSAASEDLNLGIVIPLDPSKRGAGDISFVAAIVPANLAGLGPLGWGSHSVVENIQLDSLTTQTERVAVLIYRLTC